MPPELHEFLTLDLMPLVAVTASAATLALLGSFLVLRRQAMLGDAMAHSVLPGLVAAFLVTGSRDAGPMFLGATAAAALSGLTIAAIIRHGRVERSAAIGLVYTTMFALGVLLLHGPRQAGIAGLLGRALSPRLVGRDPLSLQQPQALHLGILRLLSDIATLLLKDCRLDLLELLCQGRRGIGTPGAHAGAPPAESAAPPPRWYRTGPGRARSGRRPPLAPQRA